MPPKEPELRDTKQSRSTPYPIGEFPPNVLYEIARHIVYLTTTGHSDLSGDRWGDYFAKAIEGKSHRSNYEQHDVSFENHAWSVKTVKNENPFACSRVRLISGRNAPSHSHSINDPFASIENTGRAVLEIWNERVNRALSFYKDYRLLVLIRNMKTFQFSMFESEMVCFAPTDYRWELSKRNNFQGYDEATDEHCFTWQHHGGQFTIIRAVPTSAIKYEIRRPPTMSLDEVLQRANFDKSWLTIHPR